MHATNRALNVIDPTLPQIPGRSAQLGQQRVIFVPLKSVITCFSREELTMRCAIVFLSVFLLWNHPASKRQESQGPTDPKHKTNLPRRSRLGSQGDPAAALDPSKRPNRTARHCEKCALKIIELGIQIRRTSKPPMPPAQQLIADAKTPQQIAIAHLERGTVQYREA